jgi:hypothetical protein
MADLFRDRSCMHWWLPNDENYPPIIRSIRKFVEERTSPAKNVPAEDLRDMKAIFASLNLDDGTSSIPPKVDKGKSSSAGVTVAASQDSYIQSMGNIAPAEGDVYGLGFDDGQGYWDEGRGGGM